MIGMAPSGIGVGVTETGGLAGGAVGVGDMGMCMFDPTATRLPDRRSGKRSW
jgi:hypothetical protein